MCNKIDEKSKEFLYNLLEVPSESRNTNTRSFTNFHLGKTSAPPHYNPYKFAAENLDCSSDSSFEESDFTAKICETLNKKKETLLKLIKDYQKLSEVEKVGS